MPNVIFHRDGETFVGEVIEVKARRVGMQS